MKTTITDKTILLSKKGIKELKKNIAQLEHDIHKEIQNLHELDKTFVHDGRLTRIEKLATIENLETELDDKKMVLTHAKLMPTKRARFKVAIGSVVELIDASGKLLKFTIVNSVEANPSDGRISNLSPLGKSLIGRTVKDIIEWRHGRHVSYMQLIQIG